MSAAERPPEAGPPLWTAARGLVQASHPFPVAMVVSLTVLLGLASSHGDIDAPRLALAALAMMLSQLSIGWNNDYLDRERDAAYQPSKPVPSGLVSPRALTFLAPAAATAAGIVGATLGLGVLALLVLGTACGFAYNIRLKDTRFSWLAYVAAFALLPPYVWAATDSFRSDFLWLYAIGAPLAVAAHIANTLPDVETDTAAGAGGLVAGLGRARSLGLLFACLAAPVAVIALTVPWLSYDAAALAVTLAVYATLVLAAAAAYRGSPRREAASHAFRLIAPAAVILAAGWLASL